MTCMKLLTVFWLAAAAAEVLAQAGTQDRQLGVVPRAQDIQCESEMQVVMCGQIPFAKLQERADCCALHKPLPPQVHAAALAAAAAARPPGSWDWDVPLPERSDLAADSSLMQPVDYLVGSCSSQVLAEVPVFTTITQQVAAGSSDGNSSQPPDDSSSATPTPPSSPVPVSTPENSKSQKRRLAQSGSDAAEGPNTATVTITSVEVAQTPVPVLTSAQIKRIKSTALALQPIEVQRSYSRLAHINAQSGFLHPAGYAGPAELALLKVRLAQQQPVQAAALDSLLTGARVPPKVYEGGWFPDTHCLSTGYSGPYAMPVVSAKWGGTNNNAGTCAPNYPPAAPQHNCAHVSFVELDGQMAYKQALAYAATGDEGHAETAQRIMEGWAAVNSVWGLQHENGPLEAGWGCAAMSRAMELLKHSGWPGFKPAAYHAFVAWMGGNLMKQMDVYVDDMTTPWARSGGQNVFGNWHSTIADCWVAFGVLTDDVARYRKGVQLYHTTVGDYLRWGRGEFSSGRIVGEASETLRDIYHTAFGLGGLVQTAEQAWQQHEDIYSSNSHALLAALELHARIINADAAQNPGMFPPGFKKFKDMPEPPAGAVWRFDIRSQRWFAQDKATGKTVSYLQDGVKYLLGIGHLPTGWELAYNHYVGRLGLAMPETATLVANNWPDYFTFHWGLATLTHADSAAQLWRPGVSAASLCGGPAEGRAGGGLAAGAQG